MWLDRGEASQLTPQNCHMLTDGIYFRMVCFWHTMGIWRGLADDVFSFDSDVLMTSSMRQRRWAAAGLDMVIAVGVFPFHI